MDGEQPTLLAALRERRGRRALSPRPILKDHQDLLWKAVSITPSHGNSQPWRILVADLPEVRAKLEAALSDGNKSWAPSAPLLIALACNPGHARTKQYGPDRALWSFDVGMAVSSLLTQATSMGIVAHPMASFDELAAKEAFGAPAEIRILVVVAIGYPGPADALPADLQARETAPQSRIPMNNLVAVDRWRPENSISARELRDS